MKKQSIYKCIIIDDEPIAIRLIQDHLNRFENFKCIGTFTRPLDALDAVNNEKVDLLFLDINMPGISGIELLKSLPNSFNVIFTTAYRNFAVDAFDLNAIDYLVKPISFERFVKAMNKFLAIHTKSSNTQTEEISNKDFIIFKADKKNYKIKFTDILYIESLDNYIKIHMPDVSIICYDSLTKVEEQLPAKNFIRIHRSYIVNLTRVDVFTSAYVEINHQKFTIGRNYREKVAQRLSRF